MQRQRTRLKGFSLIEMSVVLTILSVVIAGVLPGLTAMNKSKESDITRDRMRAIEDAILSYRLVGNSLPCPSNLMTNEGSAWFGVAADTSTPAMAGACYTGALGAPGATATTQATTAPTSNATNMANYATGNAVMGAVPVRTLNLPDEYAYDAWGRRFVYAVDKRMTAANFFLTDAPSSGTGTFIVKDQAANNRTAAGAYVLVSMGQDGHGGVTSNGVRVNRSITGVASTPGADTWANCNCNASATPTAFTTTFVQRPRIVDPASSLNAFDDIVDYKTRSGLEKDTVVGSDLWSLNGTVIYPTNYLTQKVAIGQNILTTAPTATSAELLVWQDAANWTAIQDTTANSPGLRVQGSVAGNWAAVITNTNTAASSNGLVALSGNTAGNGYGVMGYAGTIGVNGGLGVNNAYGVLGNSTVAGGMGGRFIADLVAPFGVYGYITATNTAATAYGTLGQISGTGTNAYAASGQVLTGSTYNQSFGLYGAVNGGSTSTTAYGTYGVVAGAATNAYGGYGYVLGTGVTGTASGYYGNAASTTSATNIGVYGVATGGTSNNYGVFGTSSSANGYGVYAQATGAGSTSLQAISQGAASVGVDVASTATGAAVGVNVALAGAASTGVNIGSTGTGVSYGLKSSVTSATGYALYGSGGLASVYGTNSTASGYGVYGASSAASGSGVFGTASAATGAGVTAQATGSAPVAVNAALTTAAGGNVISATSAQTNTNGVFATLTSVTNTGSAIYGSSANTTGGFGVYCSAAFLNGCGGNRAWFNASDERLKTQITGLEEDNGLDAIRKLRPVHFVWDQQGLGGKKRLGFIAQDMQHVFPELVGTGQDQTITRLNGTKETVKHTLSLSYAELTVPLVKAVQQLDKLFQELKETVAKLIERVNGHDQEINALKAENAELKARLDALEKKVEAGPARP